MAGVEGLGQELRKGEGGMGGALLAWERLIRIKDVLGNPQIKLGNRVLCVFSARLATSRSVPMDVT